jgi:hypothetical protein
MVFDEVVSPILDEVSMVDITTRESR